ncbi:helix-turn-helix transcriptional regulator [Gordonia polyisoprenivorans]|uniref:helix-turn-helix transcriptional regulator n=1 Tax=Gordonia polyisoprenivorans TaxID=84595 RepID=UPI001AD7564D|nr:LuxR C-terminal-related transcriptional regulator [Gordonia polyisoprenivorans]QTI68437.1 helix-turn-helix domain-containing protein [Gordonia polyisoprenivorans]
MIIEAGCIGRDREVGEILERAAQLTQTSYLLVTGASGIGKSTLLRRVAQLAAQQDLSIRTIDDADALDTAELTEVIGEEHETHLVLLAATHESSALMSLLPDVMPLAGLDRDAVAALATARARAVHPTVVDRLTHHTAGNPRDILSLLDELPGRAWSQAGIALPAPGYVVSSVREELGACPTPARRLIEALCILHDNESLGVAIELAGITDPLDALDDALRTGLVQAPAALVPADAHPRIAGPLIQAAVLEVMGIRRVGEMHRRAADLVTDPVHRLNHRVAATPVPDAALADELDALAQARATDGEWAAAAELYRQAGRLTSDRLRSDQRTTLSVDALLAAGDCVSAASYVPIVESLRETALRNATLAYLAILRGRSADAHLRLERAWGIVSFEREPDVAALIAQRFVLHHLVRCRGDELVDWADRAIEMAGDNSPAGIEAAVIRGLGQAWSGDSTGAVASYTDLAERVRFGPQAQRVSMGRGWLELGIDDIGSARSHLETAVSMAALGGSNRISLWSLAWLARVEFLTGDWDTALVTVERGRDLAHRGGIELVTPLLNWTAAQIHSLRGDWASAHDAADRAAAPAGDYEIMRIPTLLARAQLAEAAADYGKVIRTLEPLRQMAKDTPALVEPGWWPWVDVLANALVVDGQLDEADALLTPFEERTAVRGHRSAAARLGYARARLLGSTGDIHGARRTFERSLQLLDGLPLRYDLARVNFAYGQTLRRAGKRRAADTVMATAREIYHSLGATTYVERCDRELKAGGVHTGHAGASTRADRDVTDLTPQEEAVATLVARGLSNREVAAELYISPKTVQYHLTRIYAKLGLRSRSELAASRS